LAFLVAASPDVARGAIQQFQTAEIPLTRTDWNLPLTFNKFSPSAGTLQQVVVTVSYNFQSTYDLTFIGTTPTTITGLTYDGHMALNVVNASKSIDITFPQVGQFPSFIGQASATGTVADGTISSSRQVTGTVSMTLTPSDFATPSDFYNFFVGAGTVSLPVLAHAGSFYIATPGNGIAHMRTMASASVQLAFVFIPEPTAATLLASGGGLIAIAGFGRRRGRSPMGPREEGAEPGHEAPDPATAG